jgi:hypothetical protein
MHGDMGGYYEIRVTGPGREQFRLFCMLENTVKHTRRQLNMDPCRGGRIRAYISQDELEQHVLRAEPIELQILDPGKLKGHKRMVYDLRLPIGPGYLLREHMHVKLETDAPIGTLAGIKAYSKHLGIMERWPRAKTGLKGR